MHLLHLALAKFRALFRRNAVADEIRDEMRFHLEMREAEYQQQGLTPEDARRRARKQFGNLAVIQDRGYDVRGGGVLETIWQDIRYSVRMLTKQRGFALVTILTLALAMGASTALFSVIDAALLRPVPYPNPEEIVGVDVQVRFASGQLVSGMSPSADDLDLWRASSNVFTHLGQGRIGEFGRLIVDAGEPERLVVSSISEDFLGVFGIAPILGRGIVLKDTHTGAPPIVLLGHRYWQRRFHGDASTVGRTIRVNGELATIVGVIPAGFYEETSIWRPMHEVNAAMRGMRGTGTPTYGRLRTGLTVAQAAEELTRLSQSAETSNSSDFAALLEPLYEETVARYRSSVDILSGAVVLVLLIASINVSGLLLARGATRQGELAVRASMGAGRGRLIRQLLTESLVLAAAGGLGGVLLAWLLLDGLVAVLPITLPENAPPAINLQVLAFSGVLSIVTAVVFGLVPAIRLSRAHVGSQLAHVGRRHGSPLTKRGGQLLIVAEVALALMLLAGAGLMLRSFSRALSIDVGFDPDTFVTMEVFPADTSAAAQAEYFPALVRTIRSIPGVAEAGVTSRIPLSGGGTYTAAYAQDAQVPASIQDIMPGYLEAIGLLPTQGRLPNDTDAFGATAILSETAARQLFPDDVAVGRQFTTGTGSNTKQWNVVGVVADIRSRGVLAIDNRPDVYLLRRPNDPNSSFASFGRTPIVVIRSSGRAHNLTSSLRGAALSVGPPVIVERIRSGSDWFGDSIAQTRHRTLLLSLIGGLGLVLTIAGVGGVTAYAVARRTREIGVRMAFGATPADVVGRILRDAAWPVIAGLAIGLGGAYYTTRVIESFLYETRPRDPATFAAVAIAMGIVALLAAGIPARRAAKVDPVIALRAE